MTRIAAPHRTIRGVALAVAMVAGAFASRAGTAEGPEVELRGKAELDLNSAVALALESNFGVAIRRLERASALEDVAIAKAAFEPSFNAFGNRSTNATINGVPSGEFDEYNANISQKLPTGGTVALTADTQRNDFGFEVVGQEPYTSALHLSLRQPLLKGGGYSYSHSPIVLGRIAVNETDYELRKSILELLRNVEVAYWELVFAYQAREVRQQTIANAERLVRETRERGNVGLTTGIEPLQAEAALASRQEELVLARQAIEDNSDRLLVLLGKGDRQNYRFRAAADFPLVIQPPLNDREIDRLVERLPDYRQFDEVLARRQVLVQRARNEALPQVDVGIGGGYTGIGTGYFNAYNNAFRYDQHDWQALFEVHVPLGFGSERANLRKRKFELQMDELRRREFAQTLKAQIREAARAVASGNERVRATADSLKLNRQQFEQMEAKFHEGLAPFRDTLIVQDELREASIRAIRAKADAVEARVRLARYDGTLLQRYGLLWDDPATPQSITTASQSLVR